MSGGDRERDRSPAQSLRALRPSGLTMLVLVDIPDTALPDALNGAVAELYTNTQGQPAADIRIPAPQDQD